MVGCSLVEGLSSQSGTGAVGGFESTLRSVVADVLDAPAVTISCLTRLTSGASLETWSFRVSLPDGTTSKLVLRRDPPSAIRPDGIAREAEAIAAARRRGVPVPRILAVECAADRLAAPFILMEHVDGETLGHRIVRAPQLASVRPALAAECGTALARLHAGDGRDLPALPMVDALADLRAGLDRFDASPAFELGFRWLEDRRPGPAAPALVHGDFRNGNLIIGPEGIRAVLDWELAHLGDGAEDLGWLCVRAWRFGGAGPVGGFGERADLLTAYERAGGRAVQADVLAWWEVFGTIRWGVICLAQAARHLSGTEPSVELAAIGPRMREQEYDVLGLISRRTPGT